MAGELLYLSQQQLKDTAPAESFLPIWDGRHPSLTATSPPNLIPPRLLGLVLGGAGAAPLKEQGTRDLCIVLGAATFPPFPGTEYFLLPIWFAVKKHLAVFIW